MPHSAQIFGIALIFAASTLGGCGESSAPPVKKATKSTQEGPQTPKSPTSAHPTSRGSVSRPAHPKMGPHGLMGKGSGMKKPLASGEGSGEGSGKNSSKSVEVTSKELLKRQKRSTNFLAKKLAGKIRKFYASQTPKKLPKQLWDLVEPPSGAISFIKEGQARDVWKNDFVYLPLGEDTFSLRSIGPDGAFGGGDDFVKKFSAALPTPAPISPKGLMLKTRPQMLLPKGAPKRKTE